MNDPHLIFEPCMDGRRPPLTPEELMPWTYWLCEGGEIVLVNKDDFALAILYPDGRMERAPEPPWYTVSGTMSGLIGRVPHPAMRFTVKEAIPLIRKRRDGTLALAIEDKGLFDRFAYLVGYLEAYGIAFKGKIAPRDVAIPLHQLLPAEPATAAKAIPPWIKRLLAAKQAHGDRSAVMFKLMCGSRQVRSHRDGLIALGFTRDEIFELIKNSVWDKFAGQPAFVDPSGGAHDSFALCIAHNADGRAVQDVLREKRPPFSPEAVCAEFSELCKKYRVTRVVGDHWGGEFVKEQFQKHGITYELSERVKSDLYRELLPIMNSGKCELLDHSRLHSQLCALERRTGRGGRDSIDHPVHAHDDLANCAAGAIVLASGVAGLEVWTKLGSM
jgi:hypothetical protein